MSFMSWYVLCQFYNCKENVNLMSKKLIHDCGRSSISCTLGWHFLIKFQQFQFLKKSMKIKEVSHAGDAPFGCLEPSIHGGYTLRKILVLFMGATATPTLDFWWHLLLNLEGTPPLNVAHMAAESFTHVLFPAAMRGEHLTEYPYIGTGMSKITITLNPLLITDFLSEESIKKPKFCH